MSDGDGPDDVDDIKARDELLGDYKPPTKLHVVSLHSSDPPDELQQDVEQFKRNVPIMIDFYNYEAKLQWSRYSKLVDEGFTAQQALYLIKG